MTLRDLSDLVDAARRDFFHEVGDSANALILDSSFRAILAESVEVSEDEKGRARFRGLEVIYIDSPGRKVLLAHVLDPTDECKSCRGL